jgi:hypothetical protein
MACFACPLKSGFVTAALLSTGIAVKIFRLRRRQIADEADDVLHEKPADLAKAYTNLVMLRGVLLHVYEE